MDTDNKKMFVKSNNEKGTHDYPDCIYGTHSSVVSSKGQNIKLEHVISIKTEAPASDDDNNEPDATDNVSIKKEWSNDSNGEQPPKSHLNQAKNAHVTIAQQESVKCPIPGLWLDGKFYPAYCDVQVKDEHVNIKQEPATVPIDKSRASENHNIPSTSTYGCYQCENCNGTFKSRELLVGHTKTCKGKQQQNCKCCTSYRNSSTETVESGIGNSSSGGGGGSSTTRSKEQQHSSNKAGCSSAQLTTTEVTDDDENGDNEDLIHSPAPPKRPRMGPPLNNSVNAESLNLSDNPQRNGNKNSKQTTNTQAGARSVDLFFMSMCETTKNLPSPLQLQIKRKVFEVVFEAEELANRFNENYEGQMDDFNDVSSHY